MTSNINEAKLLELAVDAPEHLVAIAFDDLLSAGMRARAAEAMARIVDSRVAVPALLRLLDHRDAVVQEGAIYGLSAHMTPEVKERLQNLASDSMRHGLIQEIAAEILAENEEG